MLNERYEDGQMLGADERATRQYGRSTARNERVRNNADDRRSSLLEDKAFGLRRVYQRRNTGFK